RWRRAARVARGRTRVLRRPGPRRRAGPATPAEPARPQRGAAGNVRPTRRVRRARRRSAGRRLPGRCRRSRWGRGRSRGPPRLADDPVQGPDQGGHQPARHRRGWPVLGASGTHPPAVAGVAPALALVRLPPAARRAGGDAARPRGRVGTPASGAAAPLLMPRHERGESEALRGLGGAGAGVAEPVVVLAAGGDLGGPLTAHHSGSPPGLVRTPRPGPGSGSV